MGEQYGQDGLDHPLVRRLATSVALTEEEVGVLSDMQSNRAHVPTGKEFVREGEEFATTLVVQSGWAMRYRYTDDGKRQIISFVLPGDFIGLHVNYERRAAYSIAAVSDVEMAVIEPIRVFDLYRNYPLLASGLDWMTVSTFNILAEHTVSLGVRPATQRILHLLLEHQCRLMAVGLAEVEGYDSPLTQSHIGDTLGLTSVYVSKCLKKLRAEGLVEVDRKRVTFPDVSRTMRVSRFDGAFLEQFRVRDKLPNALRDAGTFEFNVDTRV